MSMMAAAEALLARDIGQACKKDIQYVIDDATADNALYQHELQVFKLGSAGQKGFTKIIMGFGRLTEARRFFLAAFRAIQLKPENASTQIGLSHDVSDWLDALMEQH